MMRFFRLLLLALASILAAACSQQEMIDKSTPQAESAYAQKVVAELRAGDYAFVKQALAPQLRLPSIDEHLPKLARLFPKGAPKTVKIVGANTLSVSRPGGPVKTQYELSYEYEFPDSWVVTHIVLAREQDRLQVTGIHIQPLAQSLEETNAFTLAGKGVLHWTFLLLAIAAALFCVYAFVACVCMKGLKRKWLWALFTLIGVFTVSINWSTGELGVQPLSLLLLSAATFGNAYSPWFVNVAFPIGAVCFLWRRHVLLRGAVTVPAAPPSPPAF